MTEILLGRDYVEINKKTVALDLVKITRNANSFTLDFLGSTETFDFNDVTINGQSFTTADQCDNALKQVLFRSTAPAQGESYYIAKANNGILYSIGHIIKQVPSYDLISEFINGKNITTGDTFTGFDNYAADFDYIGNYARAVFNVSNTTEISVAGTPTAATFVKDMEIRVVNNDNAVRYLDIYNDVRLISTISLRPLSNATRVFNGELGLRLRVKTRTTPTFPVNVEIDFKGY